MAQGRKRKARIFHHPLEEAGAATGMGWLGRVGAAERGVGVGVPRRTGAAQEGVRVQSTVPRPAEKTGLTKAT